MESTIVLVAILALVGAVLSVSGPVWPWLRAKRAGAPLRLATLLDLQLRKIPPGIVVDAYIALQDCENPPSIDVLASSFEERRNEIRSSDDLVRLFSS